MAAMAACPLTSQTVQNRHRAATWTLGFALAAALLIGGCSSQSLTNAPVESRGTASSLPGMDAEAIKLLPGAENAGKPGYYSVKPGDTIIRIGLESGQNWRDLAHWNNLENANLIEVGQVLRIIPPVATAQVVTSPVTSGTVSAVGVGAAKPAPSAGSNDENVNWMWPASGSLVAGFDEAKNKGLDIAGKAGDPVLASADGRVVYAGAGLRGYGNLIILKHNNTFLTAYAHNRALLVKEDQSVKKGQKIAEMGNSDADRVKLHFEIRRQGKPVDPAKYLPAR
ncbi:peptidase [Polaromonas sp.]|nr:peptidase [Polaromonas sp.]